MYVVLVARHAVPVPWQAAPAPDLDGESTAHGIDEHGVFCRLLDWPHAPLLYVALQTGAQCGIATAPCLANVDGHPRLGFGRPDAPKVVAWDVRHCGPQLAPVIRQLAAFHDRESHALSLAVLLSSVQRGNACQLG